MEKTLSTEDIQNQTFKITHQFLTEMGAERAKLSISLHASLEKELGLGSLEKAELFHRLEKFFDVRLPDDLMVSARNLLDIIKAIEEAKPPHKLLTDEITITLQKAKADPFKATTLNEVLIAYAEAEPNRPHIYFQDENDQETIIYYGELFNQAKQIAIGLRKRGIQEGDTIAIMLPTSPEFFFAFFGVLLAGAIPVPIYPPFRPDQIEEYAKREALILRNAEVRILITFRQAEALSNLLRSFIPSLKEVATVDYLKEKKGELPNTNITANDPAFIQYTSGSTGNPKGVLLTHANLLANIHAYGKGAQVKSSDVVVSWLPLYHDMGLIGTWFGSLFHGLPLVIMSPLAFLSRPERWLWSIHRHRATISAGPNFAYELCVKKIREEDIRGLDLSSWRIALNGAEAIYSETLIQFTKKFSKYGFKKEAFFPAYGLAECAVALAFPPPGRGARIDYIERESYEKERKAIPSKVKGKDTLDFVGCGFALDKHQIRIVDNNHQLLPERQAGNVEFRGPSVMSGYYRNPEATAAIYHEGWWESGDLGYMADGELFITGRKKDVIIKAGRNIYPPEIEDITMKIEGVRRGCVAAFGIKDEKTGTEKFIIMAETAVKDKEQQQNIIKNIIESVVETLGLPPDDVVLVSPRTIPKTSSGKLRRSACIEIYNQKSWTNFQPPAWLQVGKLFCLSAFKKSKQIIKNIFLGLYTVYVGIISFFLVVPSLIVLYLFPASFTFKFIKYWSKIILKLVGFSIAVTGEENLKQDPVLYVANHASYLDILVLLAILPPNFLFVAKSELFKNVIIAPFIKKLGHLTVNRLDFTQSLKDAESIQKALEEKKSILIFPEGTFAYTAGLRTFKLGAFKLSVETKTPICPISLNGTRSILRSGSFLFHPGKIKIHIGQIIEPVNQDWNEIIRLRDETRQEIAKYCGEPTLDLVRAGLQSLSD